MRALALDKTHVSIPSEEAVGAVPRFVAFGARRVSGLPMRWCSSREVCPQDVGNVVKQLLLSWGASFVARLTLQLES
jgi:hypothetical protein